VYNLLKSKNILFVRQNEHDSELIKDLCGFFGHCFVVDDTEDAWGILIHHPVDIVMIDMDADSADSIGFVQKIKSVDKSLRIVASISHLAGDMGSEYSMLVIDRHIIKPLTSPKIHILLNDLNEDIAGDDILELVPDVLLNTIHMAVIHGDSVYNLSAREGAFMKMLARKGIATYEDLKDLWRDEPPSDNAVRSFVRHLRKKLPNGLLLNRSGIGYALKDI
jgi:DNA-binding response OmpR family regulator